MSRARRVKPGDPSRAVAYLRTSKEEQQLGIEAQRAQMEAWASAHRVSIVSWQRDHLSGALDAEDRPGLLAAVAAVRVHRAGLILMMRRDRLARDSYIAAAIERTIQTAGARILTIDGVAQGDGAEDKFMRRLLDAVAEYERALISARTKAVAAVKRSKGEAFGYAPYGFRVEGKKLVPDERERTTAQALLALRNEGVELSGRPHSLRWLTEQAQKRGFVSRTGKPLSFNLVARIVRMAPTLMKGP